MAMLDTPVLFLATADAARATAFYERLPGLRFIADEPAALVFYTGDSMLRIQKVKQVHAAPYTALGWSVGDIRQTVRELKSAGVAFELYPGLQQDEDALWHAPSGAWVAWFKDPDGHVLSLTQFTHKNWIGGFHETIVDHRGGCRRCSYWRLAQRCREIETAGGRRAALFRSGDGSKRTR